MRDMRLADPSRPINHEAARAAVRPLQGVQSAVWIDNANLLVMVGGGQYRSMATIDSVCMALEPLGDTLSVVVNLQDVMATTSQGADTLSRNCQLGAGERAMFQQKRQVDVLDPEVKRVFRGKLGDAVSGSDPDIQQYSSRLATAWSWDHLRLQCFIGRRNFRHN